MDVPEVKYFGGIIENIVTDPHSGWEFPDWVKEYFYKGLTLEQIHDTMFTNQDIHLDHTLRFLKENADGDMLQFPHSRIIDPNRIKWTDIIRDYPYRGEPLFDLEKIEEARARIIPEIVIPWQNQVVEVALQNPDKVFLDVHTMDDRTLGTSPFAVNGQGELRPPFMICSKVNIRPADYAAYENVNAKGEDLIDIDLIPKEALDGVIEIFNRSLGKYMREGDIPGQLDNPYSLCRRENDEPCFDGSLPSLRALAVKQAYDKFPLQLVIDVRKDILETKEAQEDFGVALLKASEYILQVQDGLKQMS